MSDFEPIYYLTSLPFAPPNLLSSSLLSSSESVHIWFMTELLDPSAPDDIGFPVDVPPYFISNADSIRSRLTAQEAIKALVDARGNISLAARNLGRSREKFKRFVDKTPAVLSCLATLRETLLDQAESNFANAVEHGHLESSKFVLQTFGKERGYLRPGLAASASDASGNKVTFTIEG